MGGAVWSLMVSYIATMHENGSVRKLSTVISTLQLTVLCLVLEMEQR